MNGPAYDTVEILHVIAAVIAFGSLGATGWFAAAARQRREPGADPSLRKYFRLGRNWAELAIFAVPILGGVLVAMAGRSVADRAWPWIGLGIWLVAAGAATGMVFPAERSLQQLLSNGAPDSAAVGGVARRCERGAAITSVCFVAALVVMIVKPG